MTNEIVLYQPNEQMSLEVKLENETVWLNRQQLSILFDRDVKTIGKHINNALKEELYPVVAKSTTTGNDSTSNATVAKFAIVQKEGNREVIRQVELQIFLCEGANRDYCIIMFLCPLHSSLHKQRPYPSPTLVGIRMQDSHFIAY